MLVDRSMDPGWLSNAYLVGDEEGGTAVFVDSGAPLEPLLEPPSGHVQPRARAADARHADHVAHEDELGLTVVTHALETGGLRIEALPTPGHSDDMVASSSTTRRCFSGDTLFKDAVGGGDDAAIRAR